MAKCLKCFRSGGNKLHSVPREQVPCRAIANGCRASLLYIYHAKNGGRFDAGFGPGCPVVVMAEETRIEPKPVLLALTYLRLACQTDIPYLFSATVERDETYPRQTMEDKSHHLKTGALNLVEELARGWSAAFSALAERCGPKWFWMQKPRHCYPGSADGRELAVASVPILGRVTPALLLKVSPWPVKTMREATVTAEGSRLMAWQVLGAI